MRIGNVYLISKVPYQKLLYSCNVRFIASDLRNLRKQFILSDADELAD
ncbi:TPA: hypothetical protein ACQDSE_002695 [Enterococcus faecium]|nr:hypothetical protein [Enterococcus faecium]HBM6744609.1 hypothetical protein [Enterococcus faecium]HBM7214525.1 hypothetical protein [Enterococcus faecium]